ncbi:Glutaredoxin [Aphelenchoides fujianensis]|nr:Glutaredoxin [Aphelenchoides fujianensis]
MVDGNDVVLFMKGTPQEPMCGFSKLAKTVLEHHEIDYKSYDVLADEELRQGIKDFSDWPTIPQVYVKGKFIGGSDILRQMHQDGVFHEEFEKFGIKSKYSE